MLTTSSLILTKSGKKLLPPQTAAKLLWQGKPITLPVLPSKDTQLYQQFTGIDLTWGIDVSVEDAPIAPKYNITQEHLDTMLLFIVDHPRDYIDPQAHFDRIEQEWAFFESKNVLQFIYSAWKLVERFQQDGVIWGVGRGSSVASYILYLLQVHDINPVFHGIDFSEFSKEYNTGTI